jgi:hypothetical protein
MVYGPKHHKTLDFKSNLTRHRHEYHGDSGNTAILTLSFSSGCLWAVNQLLESWASDSRT